MSVANIRYVVISAELQVPWLREVFRGQQAIVYENTLALPRAYLAERAVPVAEGGAILAMQDSSWNPLTTAFVETARPLGLPEGPLQGNAQVTRYDPDRVSVRTTASRAALLVLSDNWYKDWHATVDGKHAEILRTNHAFRGVVVPQGTHTVEFHFHSRQLHYGLHIYLACLLLLAGYGVYLLIRSRRKRDDGDAEPAPAAA
jgi:hypothetical protein